MRHLSVKEICLMVVFTILCLACFPANPLVLTGVIKTNFYVTSFIIGWIFWAIGMVLVMAPIAPAKPARITKMKTPAKLS